MRNLQGTAGLRDKTKEPVGTVVGIGVTCVPEEDGLKEGGDLSFLALNLLEPGHMESSYCMDHHSGSLTVGTTEGVVTSWGYVVVEEADSLGDNSDNAPVRLDAVLIVHTTTGSVGQGDIRLDKGCYSASRATGGNAEIHHRRCRRS
jgi:hypothetical protein